MTVPKCVFDGYEIDPATAIENSDKVPKEGPGGQWLRSWNKAGEHQRSWDQRLSDAKILPRIKERALHRKAANTRKSPQSPQVASPTSELRQAILVEG
jgi:hypothetical protein